MPPIVGREQELGVIRRFLTDAGERSHALHLHGEAGIGKSTLWHAAVDEARALGHRVVVTRPTQAEARLPFAGLIDLVGGLIVEHEAELPAPQRAALNVALQRASPGEANPEPLAIALAVLAVLRDAAERQPLLVAIDDVPWLDASTAATLEFVLRRLDTEPIGLLVAERTAPGSAADRRIVSALGDERVTELRVAPLTLTDTDRLLAAALDLALPPSRLKALHRMSGGNPFYAVEIGRALLRQGDTRTDGTLPVPETLSELLRDRLDALSVAASDVVELASALSRPTITLLGELLDSETIEAGIAEASEAHVVTTDGDAVRFTHPLFAAELYAHLGDGRRRAIHRRLAAVVSEPEEQARHAALAADAPDETVAAQLESAAERAHARGAPDAAAALLEQSLELTPGEGDGRRRREVAARYHMRAGNPTLARQRLEEALAAAPAGPARAEILLRLAKVRLLTDDWTIGERLLDQALGEAGDDARLQIRIRLELGGVSHITGRRWTAGAGHVREAMRLAEALGDPEMIARAIGPAATWQYQTGGAPTANLEQRAAELEPWTGHLRSMDHPTFDVAALRSREGDIAGSRTLQEALLERADRTGDYTSIPYLLANISRADLAEGKTDAAEERLERAERLARATGQATALGHVLVYRTMLLGRTGRVDEAWEAGRSCLALVGETGWRAGEPMIRRELALLELSRRAPDRALEVLEPIGVEPGTRGRPWVAWRGPVHAEALIGLGRLDEARTILEGWTRLAPMRRSSSRMRYVARALALLESADGNPEASTKHLAAAQTAFEGAGSRWGEARTALMAGEIHRRARRRALARAALEAAEREFAALGSVLWAAQAREQLERLAAGRDEVRGLTPTQSEVAELAADGLTNRQIGDRLFMSIHTVEAHLSAVYRTLGISGRRDLAAALRDSTAPVRDSGAEPQLQA